jgi:hypothetical protein
MAIVKKIGFVVLLFSLGIISNPFIKTRSKQRKKESIKKLKERWCNKVNATVHLVLDTHLDYLERLKKCDDQFLQLCLLKTQKKLLCHLESCLLQEKDSYFGCATRESLQKSIKKIDKCSYQIGLFNTLNDQNNDSIGKLIKYLESFCLYVQKL